jgi:RNA polymerase subunit RPABC4/transcription elongation factor Spt4
MQFPPELLNQIGVALELIVAAVAALTVAFWIAMVVWVFRDIRLRTRDIFAWILAALLALVMGPIGVILYLFLRPKETLAEVYDRQLEEEALLRDISQRRACPQCQAVTEPEWLVCPHCRTELRQLCVACGRPLELNWVVCPYCATARAGVAPRISVMAPPENASLPAGIEAPQPVLAVPGSSQAEPATITPSAEGWGVKN